MTDGIRLELSETALVASPGGAATTRCTVYNTSLIVDEYRLRIEGVDPSWVDLPTQTARIFPESFETVAAVFRPPRSATVAAGDYPFRLVAASVDNPALTATAPGVLTVGPSVDFAFDLASPRQVTGEIEGAWEFRLANTGNARLTVALAAADEPEQLDYTFNEPSADLAPGEERRVRLVARPRGGGGVQLSHAIDVSARITAVTPPVELAPEIAVRGGQVLFQQIPPAQEPPRLEPQVVELAGQAAEARLLLTNRSAQSVTIGLTASDRAGVLTFEFVGGPKVRVPAGEVLTVPVRITCLDRARLLPPPATTPYTVTATPVDPSGEPRLAQGELAMPSPADFRLRLEPEQVEGSGPARVNLVIQNVSPRRATFTVAASSRDAALQVALARTEVEVPASDHVAVPVDLTPVAEGAAAAAGPAGAARGSAFVVRVAPVDAPARANEVTGQYIFAPAAIGLRLMRKEIEAAGEAVFDLQIDNMGKGEVAVQLDAADRAGACHYTFDLPRLRIASRGSAQVRLTVKPPAEHRPDARWAFEVSARPTSPPGAAVREEGVLIYRAPAIGLALNPAERRGRRARTYTVLLSNPTTTPITARLSAVDRSGGLGVQLKQENVTVPPAGGGFTKVPLRVTPWKRTRGSGAQALSFGVAATPITPPGDATTIDGRFVAQPPRSRWWWLLLLLILFLIFAFSPLYTQSFYLAGWNKKIPHNARHTFTGDIDCAWGQVRDGSPGSVRRACFEQGPRPTPPPPGLTGWTGERVIALLALPPN